MDYGRPVCADDFEHLAAAVLPPPIRDFIAGGSGRETTLDANRAALDAVAVIPRVLRDLSGLDTSIDLARTRTTMPLAIAPLAYHALVHPDGELATARAAADAGVPVAISTLSSVTIEDVARTGATTWFQLYWLRDRKRRLDLVRRAEQAGCAALVLTVDVPWMGRRLRDLRNSFSLPEGLRAVNLDDDGATRARTGTSAVATHTAVTFAPTQTWADLTAIRETTALPLIVKGVLAAADAAQAAACGADAIVVSNHGGRQLDGAIPAIDAVAAVRNAIGDGCQILMDSGVRSGTDVLRALALGADGVLLGRPVLWALAHGGEDGVRRLLELMALEIHDALGLAGCTGAAEARHLDTVILPARPGTPRSTLVDPTASKRRFH